MSFTRPDYRSELYLHGTWPKFDSPENEERILSFLEQSQWIPSQITIDRAITHLGLQRTDGRTIKDDAREIRAAAQRSYNSAAAEADRLPLTRAELDEFSRLSQADLQRLYWGEDGQATDGFSVRYRKAAREFGFVIPPKPAQQANDDQEIVITPEIYKAMPARELSVKLRNPRVKLQIMQLIKAGLIALLIAGALR